MKSIAGLELSELEFSNIRKLVLENTGISLSGSKKELVKRRFTPRLKALGLGSFASYVKHMKHNHAVEVANFCNAITTNLTSFFRENHHFEFMKDEVLPAILERNDSIGRKLRLWSAGCSTGQEAYCLAMNITSFIPAIDRWDVKILASDLDEKCLDIARRGIYAHEGFDKMSDDLITRYFVEVEQENVRKDQIFLQARPELRQMIRFNKLNLVNSYWPMKGMFDVIFCRNVFIYFDKDTQLKLVKRFSAIQTPGSYLFLGHSETIADPQTVGYRLMGKTLYIRE